MLQFYSVRLFIYFILKLYHEIINAPANDTWAAALQNQQ